MKCRTVWPKISCNSVNILFYSIDYHGIIFKYSSERHAERIDIRQHLFIFLFIIEQGQTVLLSALYVIVNRTGVIYKSDEQKVLISMIETQITKFTCRKTGRHNNIIIIIIFKFVILYSKLLYKMGHYFLDIKYNAPCSASLTSPWYWSS